MRSSRGHTQFVLERSLEWFALKTWRSGGSLWFLTLTFSENITDLGEAWRRWKPAADWFRRKGISAVGAWQQQKRGAWHVHIVIDGRIDITLLREFLVDKGWGPFCNIKRVEKPPAGLNEAQAALRRTIGYISRYVKRDIAAANGGPDAAAGRRVTVYLCGTKKGTVRFNFTNDLNHVWRLGCALWCEIFKTSPAELYRSLSQDSWRGSGLRVKIMEMGLDAVWGNPSFAHLLESSRLILLLGQMVEYCPF